jgi:acyl carrier protein
VQGLNEQEAAGGARKAELAVVVGDLWREVLGHEAPDDDTGFFDAGGDSLLLLALVARLSEVVGLRLKTLAVYQAATIHGQASLLYELQQEHTGPSAPRG